MTEWSKSGDMLVAGSLDGTAKLWHFDLSNLRNPAHLQSIQTFKLSDYQLSQDVPLSIKNTKNFFQSLCQNIAFTKSDKYIVMTFLKQPKKEVEEWVELYYIFVYEVRSG